MTIVILRRYYNNSCNIGAVTRMTEDINKMKSIRAAYKGHCTQDFKKADKLITSKSSDHAELEALVDRLTRRAGKIAQMDAKICDVFGDRGRHFKRQRISPIVSRQHNGLAIQN